MKTAAYKKLLITFIALSSWLIIHGQQYPDSLIKYLEIAAKNNPAVLQKFSEYKAALQKIPQVGSLSDPELSMGFFLKPMELVNGNQIADIKLMQMFPWFGVLRNAKDEMSLMANARFELFRDTKLQVFYDLQRTWYELYKVQKDISISEKNIEILKVIERLALIRFKSAPSSNAGTTSSNTGTSSASNQAGSAGSSGMQTMGTGQGNYGTSSSNQPAASMQTASMGSSSGGSGLVDLYRIQIETGDLENNIALLKNQEQSITARFNSYLNRSPVAPVFIGDTLVTDSLGLILMAVSDSILAKNPMLTMLEYEKQSLEARKKMVSHMGYPMMGVGLNYSIISKTQFPMGMPSMNGKDMIMPMVVFTLPIYRKKYTAMQNEAELMKTAASENYQATANSLQTEYYQAIQLYQDAKRRIKLYGNQYQLASKSFDIILKSFSASSSGLTDVLRVRQQTLDYELKQVEAIADFNTAVSWLKRLMAFSQIQ
jgi:outer membrane protein TolC